MSGLDEKGLRAAIFPNGENPLWTDMQRGAVDDAISRVVRYLAAATPADVGELVERFGMIDEASGHEPLYFGKVNDVEDYAIAGEQYVRLSDYAALRARLETVEAVSDDMVRHVLTKLDPTWEDDCTAKSRANQRSHMRKTIIAIMDAIRNLEPNNV